MIWGTNIDLIRILNRLVALNLDFFAQCVVLSVL